MPENLDNQTALDLCHTGGIKHVVAIPSNVLPVVLEKLTHCHPHVFVIDRGFPNLVRVGVSDAGLGCVEKCLEGLM